MWYCALYHGGIMFNIVLYLIVTMWYCAAGALYRHGIVFNCCIVLYLIVTIVVLCYGACIMLVFNCYHCGTVLLVHCIAVVMYLVVALYCI